MEQMDYEIDLIECLQILGKRKWLILTLVMVSALSAYIISANMTKIYSSSCKVMVIPNPLAGSISLQEATPRAPQVNIKDYVELLTTRALVEETIERLGWQTPADRQAVDYWHKNLSASQIAGTNMILVSAENHNPERIAVFLNTLIEVFREKIQSLDLQTIGAAKAYIAEQLAIAEEKLRQDEEALLKYRQDTSSSDLTIETIAGAAKTVILEKLLLETTAKLESARAEGGKGIAGLKAEQDAIDKALRQTRAELAGIPEKEMEIARLERNLGTSENVYTMLRARYEELEILEAVDKVEINAIDPAIVPDKPIKPRVLLNTAIAGILGLFIGVGVVFVMEHMDRLK
jgi:uncharacterized protein involved in exopolysaccharide biosynthesis